MALTAYFIDVGEGDAIYLRYDAPDEIPRHILVDGGRESTADHLTTFLQRQGVTRLHLVVATHVDNDHITGLLDIFAKFPVARFWGPDLHAHDALKPLAQRAQEFVALSSANSPGDDLVTIESVSTYERLHTLALNSGALIEYPIMGHDASNLFPGLELRVMGPAPQFAQTAELTAPDAIPPEQVVELLSSTTNNSSIVVRIGCNGQQVLLTGDAELPSWHAMIEQWGAGLHARVLKLSHHGSITGTSPDVLNIVRPRQAVICVGQNSYGHPNANVLQMLQPPIQVYRTDQKGDVVIRLEDSEPVPPPLSPRSWRQQLLDLLFGRH